MTIEQTVEIPAHPTGEVLRLTIEVPREVPAGPVVLTFTPKAESLNALSRIGFLSGQISVPPDFDTMGQAEIAALFGETV